MPITAHEANQIIKESVRESIRKRAFLFILQGFLLTLAGLCAILFPVFMGASVVILLGWLLIFSGLAQLISLLSARESPSFFMQLVSIVLYVVIGVLLLNNVGTGLVIVTMLMLVTFMVGGMARIVFALMIRPLPNWGWILGGGVVAVLCSFILFANLPSASAWLLGLLLGLNLLGFGLSEMYLAWQIRNAGMRVKHGAQAAAAGFKDKHGHHGETVSEPEPGVAAVEPSSANDPAGKT